MTHRLLVRHLLLECLEVKDITEYIYELYMLHLVYTVRKLFKHDECIPIQISECKYGGYSCRDCLNWATIMIHIEHHSYRRGYYHIQRQLCRACFHHHIGHYDELSMRLLL